MEKVDLSRPGALLPASIDGVGETEEVERIELAFLRMMRRLEAERRRAGSAALRGPGGGAGPGRPRPPRRGQPVADRAAAAARGRPRGGAAASWRPSWPRPRRWPTRRCASCSRWPASCARPRSTTSAWRRPIAGPGRAARPRRDRGRRSISDGDFSDLGDDAQLVVYRVAQEALSNAARHSGAARVEVGLRRRDDGGVELSVADDGRGFAFDGVRARPRPRRHARARAAGRRRADDRVPPRRRHHRPARRPRRTAGRWASNTSPPCI